ncbi:MAG TPA: sugar phosphate isomerase/epimerase family protein [Bryobacteraceae bacterium]|nr:sugar phosphate isomerase/epimerase family protein [Bryobacteraceae bacterium]
MPLSICLFASTSDIANLGFIVKVLTGDLDELPRQAVAWGYDGIEFMPDPEKVPEPNAMEGALKAAGAVMPVVNSGRMGVQRMALLHEDEAVRRRSIAAFKRMLDFAGYFGARVGLGVARGKGIPGATREEMDSLAAGVFPELADHAERAGAVIMLEPADPGVTSYINTMDEAMEWVRRIASPAFSVMLDTYELAESEPSIEHGIRAACGQARHIHLYDPSRWPPGVRAETSRLDWPRIFQLLRETGFQGSASVVLVPEGDPAPAARQTASFLRRALTV